MKKLIDILLGKSESLKHTRNYMMGQIINKGLHFLLIPITTALLTEAEYGTNSLFNSTVNIFVVLLPLCIYKGVSRFYYDLQYDKKEMLGNQFLLMMIWMTLMSIISATSIPLWKGFSGLTTYLCLWMIFNSFMQSIINFYLAFLQSRKQSSIYAMYSVVIGVATTLISIVWMMQLEEQVFLGVIYANSIVRTIAAIVAIVHMWPHMKFNMNATMRKEIYHFNLPLIPQMISSFILNYVDRYMINAMVDSASSGLYSFAYNFGIIINIIVLAINQTFGPEFYEMMNKKNYDRIARQVSFYQKGLLTISSCIVLFAPEVVRIIANPRYHVGIPVIPAICYGYVAFHLYATVSCYCTYYKKNSFTAIISIVASIINIILNYFGIKHFGYQAAAYTTVICQFIQYLLCRYGVTHILKIQTHAFDKSLKEMIIFILLTYAGLYCVDTLQLTMIPGILFKSFYLLFVFAYIWREELHREKRA
ncbi:MAG: hypothetical protein E7191_03980 [Erysipelotrichaceae bacterium]|nr:hypothetical protein [Erysipelotrichaceae bacterium]